MYKLIVFLLAILILFLGGTSLYFAEKTQEVKRNPQPLPDDTKVLDPHEIFNLVNDYRVHEGLKSLIWNDQICKFAQQRAHQIAYEEYSHAGYEKDNYQDARKYLGNGYMGENIDIDTNDQNIVKAWLGSPGHRENILNPNFSYTCVATLKYNYAVQEFASF